jgi:ankyrin repeat protein
MNYFNNISLRKFDKGLAIDRTLNIKDDLIKKCKNYYEVLFLYIKYGEYHKFKKIFEYFNLSTEIYDNEGNSLLNLAVQCESTKLVKYLLLKDANPNSQNFKLNSPLHYALIYKNFEIADILIKYGACENLKNGEGLTPWQCLNN